MRTNPIWEAVGTLRIRETAIPLNTFSMSESVVIPLKVIEDRPVSTLEIDGLASDVSPIFTAIAAREKFLAKHGPNAEVPRRKTTPRAIRKALVQSEMALWECF